MQLKTIPYNQYEADLPQSGNWVLGQTIDESIIVYQAFNKHIAEYALKHQRFGGHAYSFNRMTWIKPNFLWMMYRAGWATKPNQERILAIKIKKEGFFELLDQGVYSSFKSDKYTDRATWQQALADSEVRIQWDPDHGPNGEKLQRRAVQIGIKGAALANFNEQYIEQIMDVTPFVKTQKQALDAGQNDFLVIKESVIALNAKLNDKYTIGEVMTK